MTDKLKRCPFCGGVAHLDSDCSSERNETRWSIWHECDRFKGGSNGYGYSLYPWFETPWYGTEAEAIEAWNTRAELGSGRLTAEQVREAIERHGIASLGCRWQFIDRSYEAIADELNAMLREMMDE